MPKSLVFLIFQAKFYFIGIETFTRVMLLPAKFQTNELAVSRYSIMRKIKYKLTRNFYSNVFKDVYPDVSFDVHVVSADSK